MNIVGASLLAMVVNDYACCLNTRGGLRFFASIRASTGYSYKGRALARLQLLIWLVILIHRPLREAEWRYSSEGSA